ncbi:hypothetical protein SOVF_122020 [Spinacia oleracea]|nr:hypothetical protein SOVF_122020 [Spinacia oleracea]
MQSQSQKSYVQLCSINVQLRMILFQKLASSPASKTFKSNSFLLIKINTKSITTVYSYYLLGNSFLHSGEMKINDKATPLSLNKVTVSTE